MKVYEWTRGDFDFVARVALAVRACGLDLVSDDSTWSAFGFCANRWGPCSPAAIGCLRELVREAYGDDRIAASWSHATGGWLVWSPSRPGRLARGASEPEALQRCLDAAP